MKDEAEIYQTIKLIGCTEFFVYSRGINVTHIRGFWVLTSPCSVKYASSAQKTLKKYGGSLLILVITHSANDSLIVVSPGCNFCYDCNLLGQRCNIPCRLLVRYIQSLSNFAKVDDSISKLFILVFPAVLRTFAIDFLAFFGLSSKNPISAQIKQLHQSVLPVAYFFSIQVS